MGWDGMGPQVPATPLHCIGRTPSVHGCAQADNIGGTSDENAGYPKMSSLNCGQRLSERAKSFAVD